MHRAGAGTGWNRLWTPGHSCAAPGQGVRPAMPGAQRRPVVRSHRMARIRFTVIALASMLAACSQPETAHQEVRAVLQRIANVELDVNSYPSYAEYHSRVYARINGAVHQLSATADLKTLFLECHRLWRNAPEQSQEKLQWIDPHGEACKAILFRLADLDCEEATRVLVELYGDETFGWDGEFSLNGANAISRCGKRALPDLASPGRRIPHAREIALCIENGELYGP